MQCLAMTSITLFLQNFRNNDDQFLTVAGRSKVTSRRKNNLEYNWTFHFNVSRQLNAMHYEYTEMEDQETKKRYSTSPTIFKAPSINRLSFLPKV